jgi:hypothetical protein
MTQFVVTLFPFRQQVTVDTVLVTDAAELAQQQLPDADWAIVDRADAKPQHPDPWHRPIIRVVFR